MACRRLSRSVSGIGNRYPPVDSLLVARVVAVAEAVHQRAVLGLLRPHVLPGFASLRVACFRSTRQCLPRRFGRLDPFEHHATSSTLTIARLKRTMTSRTGPSASLVLYALSSSTSVICSSFGSICPDITRSYLSVSRL